MATAADTKTQITILYDAFGRDASMKKVWGFSALVEVAGKRILFDTGNDADIFAANVRAKNADLTNLDFVVLSHRHSDHMAGLNYVLSVNPKIKIYAPKEGFGIYGSSLPSSFYRKDGSLPSEMRYYDGNPPEVMKFGTAWQGANFELIDKTTELAKADIVKRGEYLAKAADCMVCHTAPDGEDYAGGLAFPLPFGTLYSTNITADKNTGIGNYSDLDFLNAVQRGIRKDGARLYPAMPYTSYTFMTDADVLAIKAYLLSLPAVPRQKQRDTLQFPFNQRWSMIFWTWAFNPDTRFAPNTEKSAEWNRGAYIAEALAHCGECHTPRNLAFALDNRRKFASAVAAGWRAYDITSDKGTGIGAWTDDEVFAYLAKGHTMGHGTASGPMGEAVDRSFSHMEAADIRALVTYLRSIPAIASSEPATIARVMRETG